MKNLFNNLSFLRRQESHSKKYLLFLFVIAIFNVQAQEKQQDSTKTEKLDEVLVKAVRVNADSPITHSIISK